ncbi:TPA: hypothetical protein QDZ42_003393 [Stenotrophomonas maltophilia]|uniref:hypothetical protein n=1 Tax=Stenotrophomonas TaxID=40323 RepID=UPI0028AD981B|nr:hypothetical protein [Stenotrophomonas sp.]HDS1040509.1 hypothetical protein [Stenotrophomonas maltophilia]HDS1044714.1 hypothetical protein [Stenotrophomonas maltophilia]
MKAIFVGPLLLAAVVGLSGCGPASYEVSAGCEQGKRCKIQGKISGTFGGKSNAPLYQRLLSLTSAELPDANDFVIDVGGSSVAFPGSGSTRLRLVDESTGREVASRSFAWVRAGNTLRLDDPNAVNAWVAAEGGSANALRYDMGQINVGARPGPNTIVVASKYRGISRASMSSDFTVCTIYPSPYPCRM